MAGKKKHDSALIEAARAFDEALDAHGRAAELFVRSSLSTTKQLERANELLGEIAAAEELLRERGAALGAAVSAARDRQEQAAGEVVARLPYLKERNLQLQSLLQTFQVLGVDAVELNTSAPGSTPAELAARVTAMSERAAALAADARTSGFEELANQAHALHQRLAATARKLHGATLG
jgi:hypothetical protein